MKDMSNVIERTPLAYLDHNVIDLMKRSELAESYIRAVFTQNELTPVYSYVNIEEIAKAQKAESQQIYLRYLAELGAKLIVPKTTGFQYTGFANIHTVDPFEVFNEYTERRVAEPEYGYGHKGLLQKFYGARPQESYGEVLSNGAREFHSLIEQAKLEDKDGQFAQSLDFCNAFFEENFSSLGQLLDAQEQRSVVSMLDRMEPFGPMTLNNVDRRDVLERIYTETLKLVPESAIAEIKSNERFKDSYHFYGLQDLNTNLEKVNHLYHYLNFYGYYRDKRMQKTSRMDSHINDMTHAGIASFCAILFSVDKDLIHKARAAYSYLNIGVQPILLSLKNEELIVDYITEV